jgi:glucuronate isomerase
MSKENIIDENFLLKSELAKTLFEKYSKDLPIIDYHCHLSAKEIYEDKVFDNLYDVMLKGDHYKWRLLRTNGVDESYITGDKDPFEKFKKWASTIPYLIGSPLFHWTHFELKNYFGVNELLNEDSAKKIYDKSSKILKTLSARKIVINSNVEVICTTDDPTDSLEYHKLLREENKFKPLVIPAFRPDKFINIDLPIFIEFINKLSDVVGYKINTLDDLQKALKERVIYFTDNHCKLSDHGLDILPQVIGTYKESSKIFKKALKGSSLSQVEVDKYKAYILVYLGSLYNDYGWTQQYHIGAKRNLSTRDFNTHGPDTGYDAINDAPVSKGIALILDELNKVKKLPKTIVYPLNPSDFESVLTIIQCFQDGITQGKLQFGSAWWFLDSIDGMTKQIKSLAGNGMLSHFVGMLTDSRSFLSYSRHEYFRRLLCNIIASWVDDGLYPNDIETLGKIISNISYYNAKNYFNFT